MVRTLSAIKENSQSVPFLLCLCQRCVIKFAIAITLGEFPTDDFHSALQIECVSGSSIISMLFVFLRSYLSLSLLGIRGREGKEGALCKKLKS
jgi:hypothetical protein